MRSLLYLLLLLAAPNVLAGPFDPPSTDQSIRLLGFIFGDSIGSLPLGGAINPVLSELVRAFNFIILVVGLIVMSYVAIFSVINTAHEGSAMGKRWSAIWVPMRSVAGLALMVPAPTSGYSMIQVTVMWIVLQGIGAADSIWNIALDGIANSSSPSTGDFVDPNLTRDGAALAKNILNAAICMESLHKYATTSENVNSNNGNGNWISRNGQLVENFSSTTPTITSTNTNASVTGISYFGVNNPSLPSDMQVCGKLTVTGSVASSEFPGQTVTAAQLSQYALQIYEKKMDVINEMLQILTPIAQGLVDDTYSLPLTNGQTSNNPPPSGSVIAASKVYSDAMTSLITPALSSGTSLTPTEQALQDTVENGKNNGWITAGSFYFVFNQKLSKQKFISATPGHDNISDTLGTIPNCSDDLCKTNANNNLGFPAGSPVLTNLQNNGLSSQQDIQDLARLLAEGAVYYDTDFDSSFVLSTPGSSSGPGSSSVGQALSVASNANSSMITSLMNTLHNTNGDPLLNQAMLGQTIMLIIEGIFIGIIRLALTVGLSVMLPDRLVAAASSIPMPRLGSYSFSLVINILSIFAFLLPLFALMWGFGAMLAVYCPLIPYMIFTMTAVGWMLTVIEAMIAAPVVALGIIMPTGDEIGKLESALPILTNIFLRPILMIFGFILAGRVYMAIASLINMGMSSVYSSIDTSTMFSALVVLAVYTTFIVSVANTSFSLIYAIPDNILRWIGGSYESTSTEAKGTLSELKGASKAAEQEIGGGIAEVSGMAGKKVSDTAAKGVNTLSKVIKEKEKKDKDEKAIQYTDNPMLKKEEEKEPPSRKEIAEQAAKKAQKKQQEKATAARKEEFKKRMEMDEPPPDDIPPPPSSPPPE